MRQGGETGVAPDYVRPLRRPNPRRPAAARDCEGPAPRSGVVRCCVLPSHHPRGAAPRRPRRSATRRERPPAHCEEPPHCSFGSPSKKKMSCHTKPSPQPTSPPTTHSHQLQYTSTSPPHHPVTIASPPIGIHQPTADRKPQTLTSSLPPPAWHVRHPATAPGSSVLARVFPANPLSQFTLDFLRIDGNVVVFDTCRCCACSRCCAW